MAKGGNHATCSLPEDADTMGEDMFNNGQKMMTKSPTRNTTENMWVRTSMSYLGTNADSPRCPGPRVPYSYIHTEEPYRPLEDQDLSAIRIRNVVPEQPGARQATLPAMGMVRRHRCVLVERVPLLDVL